MRGVAMGADDLKPRRIDNVRPSPGSLLYPTAVAVMDLVIGSLGIDEPSLRLAYVSISTGPRRSAGHTFDIAESSARAMRA
ncbi:hypothetical protein XAP412_1170001 [Xanthomonas phaseoli pv. phaseoli]|uniref:Uncharacterized protein n=1 Tax=Xanthomonas campestris pv. phaseoli TaxID=317013 RepID=A0AB38DV55_XANCH|nr:hypothetical protein XAP6984_1210001 [Xanthomonas phaseoli pv. phaseoli]SON76781.1 hypothetical protein XAP412_1170001 [Xanthomonas phaseoli pv. phaseoli]SON81112.1 hypothetical protein XAP7430_1180001 [Xanthomonas phaseoli pv. phaseoli]